MPAPTSTFYGTVSMSIEADKKKAVKDIRAHLSEDPDRGFYDYDLDKITVDSILDAEPVRYDEIEDADHYTDMIENDGEVIIVPVLMPEELYLDHNRNIKMPRESISMTGRTTVTPDEIRLLKGKSDKEIDARIELDAELCQAIIDDYAGEDVEVIVTEEFSPNPYQPMTFKDFDPSNFSFYSAHYSLGQYDEMVESEEQREQFTLVADNKIVGSFDTEEEANKEAKEQIVESYGSKQMRILRSVEVSTSQQAQEDTVIDIEVSFRVRAATEDLNLGYFVFAKRAN